MLYAALYSNEDVYSICESVYYSCNNDEYDYVLECVNNWIMGGGYNEDILLESIMASPIIIARSKVVDYHAILSPNPDEVGPKFYPSAIPDSANINNDRFNNMEIGSSYTTKTRNFTQNGRYFVGRYVKLPRFISKLPPDLAQAFKNKTNGGFDDKGRATSAFIGWEYKPNGTGEIPKPMSDIAMARIWLKQLATADFNSETNTSRQSKFHSVTSVKSSEHPLINFDTHKVNNDGSLVLKNSESPEQGKQTHFDTFSYFNSHQPKKSNPQQPTPNNTQSQSRLSRDIDWVKNNKGKTVLGVGLGAAAIGGGIYAYKQYKNKPKSVIGKRIAALRGIYKKFMMNAQKNPQKSNIFKRIAAKILSVIDKLMAYMQNAAG